MWTANGKHTRYYERGEWLIQIERDNNSFDFLIHRGKFLMFWWRKSKHSEIYQYSELIIFAKLIFHKIIQDNRKKIKT